MDTEMTRYESFAEVTEDFYCSAVDVLKIRPLKIQHAFFSHVPVMMSHVRNKCDDLPLRE